MSDIVYKKNGFSIPFLYGFRKLIIPIVDDAGNPVWPEVFDSKKISEIRQIVGERYFLSQMMLDFVPLERVHLDPGLINLYDAEYDSVHAKIDDFNITGIALYWDPSSGRINSDGSVCVMIYRNDVAHNIFIHDVKYIIVPESENAPILWQCNTVLDLMARYSVRRISIETNGIGGTLPDMMKIAALQRGMSIIIDKVTNSKNKSVRICDAIEPLLGAGHLFAHSRIVNTQLFSEMLGWTPNSNMHDDGLDAVAGAIRCVSTPVYPHGKKKNIIQANTDFII